MTWGQFVRIERMAGGHFASNRAFIRAAHRLVSKSGKSRRFRDQRHKWLRDGLDMRDKSQSLFF